jgi:hypothetical protein
MTPENEVYPSIWIVCLGVAKLFPGNIKATSTDVMLLIKILSAPTLMTIGRLKA